MGPGPDRRQRCAGWPGCWRRFPGTPSCRRCRVTRRGRPERARSPRPPSSRHGGGESREPLRRQLLCPSFTNRHISPASRMSSELGEGCDLGVVCDRDRDPESWRRSPCRGRDGANRGWRPRGPCRRRRPRLASRHRSRGPGLRALLEERADQFDRDVDGVLTGHIDVGGVDPPAGCGRSGRPSAPWNGRCPRSTATMSRPAALRARRVGGLPPPVEVPCPSSRRRPSSINSPDQARDCGPGQAGEPGQFGAGGGPLLRDQIEGGLQVGPPRVVFGGLGTGGAGRAGPGGARALHESSLNIQTPRSAVKRTADLGPAALRLRPSDGVLGSHHQTGRQQ